METKERTTCSCDKCKSACSRKPGWFMPNEAEKAAESLGMTLKEFFDKHLAVDFYEGFGGEEDTFVLSPAVKGNQTGAMFPYKPTGVCVLFKEGKCSIHGNSPFECGQYIHTDSTREVDDRHIAVKEAWKGHQKQIEELLGEKPYASENEGGLMDSLFW